MENNYYQVGSMTDEEQTQMYRKFKKDEIIKMLIAANKFYMFYNRQQASCFHEWVAIFDNSSTAANNSYRCLKCGAIIRYNNFTTLDNTAK